MFEDVDRAEKQQKAGMLRVRLMIFGVVMLIGLIGGAIIKWNSSALHDKLAKRHQETTANITRIYKNDGIRAVYALTYTFDVNGKTYESVGYSEIYPKVLRCVVWFDPDNPEENEMQPIPPESAFPGIDQ